MNAAITTLGIVVAGLIGFLLGKSSKHPSIRPLGGVSDASLFNTTPGTDGFCSGKVLKKRMKGRTFHWHRVGGCRPAEGSRFEIRLKDRKRTNPLIPPVPSGVNDIWADVDPEEPEGNVYEYSLWQVLADGRERELDDPELEIGHI